MDFSCWDDLYRDCICLCLCLSPCLYLPEYPTVATCKSTSSPWKSMYVLWMPIWLNYSPWSSGLAIFATIFWRLLLLLFSGLFRWMWCDWYHMWLWCPFSCASPGEHWPVFRPHVCPLLTTALHHLASLLSSFPSYLTLIIIFCVVDAHAASKLSDMSWKQIHVFCFMFDCLENMANLLLGY